MSAITGSLGIACSDFQFKIADGTPICGRNMDFPNIAPMKSRFSIHPIKEIWTSSAPDGSPGFCWSVAIGFVGISAFNTSTDPTTVDDVVDGLNTEGLSGGVLTLKASQYQDVPPGCNDRAITQMDLLPYILGTCRTVADIEPAVSELFVWPIAMAQLPTPPALHYVFHDREGNNLVVEFLGGIPQFYLNQSNVTTNDPALLEQLENLKQFAQLTPTLEGEVGLPGATDPQSRFVTLTKLTQFTQANAIPANINQGIMRAQSLLGRVHVIEGEQIVSLGTNNYLESTLWSVIKILGEELQIILYSKENPNLRGEYLSVFNFNTVYRYPKIRITNSSPEISPLYKEAHLTLATFD